MEKPKDGCRKEVKWIKLKVKMIKMKKKASHAELGTVEAMAPH